MTNAKIVLSKVAHCNRWKSYRSIAALILTTLMLVTAATTVATAQTYSVLYNFDGTHGSDPEYPALLAQGRDSALYGTTPDGGTNGYGVVFKILPTGKLKVLYNFDGAHGIYPVGGLTLGRDGNFYGTAYEGGTDDVGTIFKITKSGTLTTLHSFTRDTDGGGPFAPPIQGTDGNFYGTTTRGIAYKVTTSGSFTPFSLLGHYFCVAPLLQGTNGSFYGAIAEQYGPWGVAFKMSPKGVVKIIHKFRGTEGKNPYAPLIQGMDGNFYGTTVYGGTGCGTDRPNCGTAFRLTPQGALTVLHSFGDPTSNDGFYPYAGLVQATDGNFYGVTTVGGTAGFGVIFKMTPDGGYSILYNFDGTHGADTEATPMQHTNGKIYGLTGGGSHGQGAIYSLDLGLAPFVKTLPTSGVVGRAVEILGGGLTGTTAVSFNGTAATFTVVSDTYMKTTVPTGATSGFVTVTTPGGALKSNQEFRVKP